jgi:hypothetical protein
VKKIVGFIQSAAANKVVRQAVESFVLAGAPLVVAAYKADGVHGMTAAVALSAVIAGTHAAWSAVVARYSKPAA